MKGKWIGFVTVVCVSMFSGASAEDVNFPDANLEAEVRDALGIPAPTPITDTDMAGLVSFSARSSGISNIQGLEYGINLTDLDLNENQISDISAVAGLTNLTNLRLYTNQISDISPVAGLTNLDCLWLGNNQISDISGVAGLTNLTYLRLCYNQISDLSAVAGLTNLTELDLDGSQISDISAVAGLTNLARLRLNHNTISDISPVAGLTNLNQLWLRDSQISDISGVAGGLTNLSQLYLAGNQISDISAVAGMMNLTYLELNHNQISDISPVAGLTNLTHLCLDDNQIEMMNLSSADLSSLRDFRIGGNPLTTVLLVDATFSQTGFNTLMRGDERDDYGNIGIAELPGVLILDMSGVDFTEIPDLSMMYHGPWGYPYGGMDDLEKLLLAGATNLDGGQVVTLTGELASLNWLDVMGLWDSFDVAEQGSLNAWDAVPGNTLIVPEPATLALLALGLCALRRRKA